MAGKFGGICLGSFCQVLPPGSWVPPQDCLVGNERAWSGLWAPSPRNIWICGFGLSTSRHPWTSANDHHSGWSDLQKKIGRGTLDLELTLDSYSGAPRGPRASTERLLSLRRNVTNVLAQGSTSYKGRARGESAWKKTDIYCYYVVCACPLSGTVGLLRSTALGGCPASLLPEV